MGRVGENKSAVVAKLPRACSDELAAVEFLEEQRWGSEPACPRCGDTNVAQMKASNGTRSARYLWRCYGCKQQFTVRIGTVFEDSRIPLRHWCYAFWAACASKKGVSALQIKRQTGLSYKSALFLMHRIRYAMTTTKEPKLSGIVEVDETYVGGKPRKPSLRAVRAMPFQGRSEELRARGQAHFKAKPPVVAMVERGGRVRARVVTDVTNKTLRSVMRSHIEPSAVLHTDELAQYVPLAKEYSGHGRVKHSIREYARGDVHVNTAESFFSLLKRGLIGTFHAVSKKHLHRYVNEFAFRWNTRRLDDGDRTLVAIRQAEGKRLMYKEPKKA